MKFLSQKIALLISILIAASLHSGCGLFHHHGDNYYTYDWTAADSTASVENDIQTEDQSDTEEQLSYQLSHAIINDIVSTSLDVSFNWKKQHMNGKATIVFKPHFYPTDSLTLDAKGFDIHKLELISPAGNKLLNYVYDSSQLHIFLDRKYSSAEQYSLLIEYTAKPNERTTAGSSAITDAKGLYFINPLGEDKNKPTELWTQGETESNSAWFPTIDKPNMKTLIDISMTVDTQFTTISNGVMISSADNKNGTRTDHWKLDRPIAPYLVMMGAGNWKITHDTWKGMPVDYYLEPEYSPYAKDIFGRTPEMIDYYSTILGVPYPWGIFKQVVVRDFVSGAMENVSAVVHFDALNRTHREIIDGNMDDIICHELFHHWFGDLVTCESWSNIPLNESFATFGEVMWNEYKYGKDAGDHQHLNDLNSYLLAGSENPVDLIRFYYADKEDMFDVNSYQRGGCVLYMLRAYVGDDVFYKALNVYLTQNKFKTVEIHNLRLAFEEVTGQDLNWFFNEYFLSSGLPVVNISYNYSDGSNAQFVTIEQTQTIDEKNPAFTLPVDVDLYFGNEVKHYRVMMNQPKQTFTFPAYSKPDLVNVDASKSILWQVNDNKSDSEYVFQYLHAPLYMDRYEAIKNFQNEQDLDENSRLALIASLNDKYWSLRKDAINALALDDEKTIADAKPLLINLVKTDPKPQVRTAALKKLATLNDKDLVNELASITEHDSSYSVLATTINALKDVNPDRAYQLALSLKNENTSSLLNVIAGTLASKGNDSDFSWFENKLNTADGYELFSLITKMKDYLVNCGSSVRRKGIDLLATIATSNKASWICMSAEGDLKQVKDSLESKEDPALADDIAYIQHKLDEVHDQMK